MENGLEFVLVVERSKLFTRWVPCGFFYEDEQMGVMRDWKEVMKDSFFMERAYAETHSQYKQIIPYIVVSSNKDSVNVLDETTYPTFVYQRIGKWGEKRLHNKFSIGVGGHINSEDQAETRLETFVNGGMRELQEELDFISVVGHKTVEDQLLNPIGFINDDTTDVGSVHFGVVCAVLVDHAEVRETSQIRGRFVYPHLLYDYPRAMHTLKQTEEVGEFESWSQFLIDAQENMNGTKETSKEKEELLGI